eukprot:scaffold19007_cov71-Phaeocystis_antarctica.AAC.8
MNFASPRSTEYCCAICIELLLRPVVLSCGHRLCRGCWVRVLQGSQARAVASRTGYATCPLGRCEVRPCVPDVDLDLESEMRERIGFKQLAAHAAAAGDASLTEESAAVAAVNAWAAAGCTLDEPEEIEATEELAAAVAAAAAAALALETLERGTALGSTEALGQFSDRGSQCAFLLIMLTLVAFGLFILNEEIGVRVPILNSLRPVPNTCAIATPRTFRAVFELDRLRRSPGTPAPTTHACLTLRTRAEVPHVVAAGAHRDRRLRRTPWLCCCCCCWGFFRFYFDQRVTINYGDAHSAGSSSNPHTVPAEPQSVSGRETERLSAKQG